MFRSLRTRMADAGVVAGLVLSLTVAAPASAATTFYALTNNEAASALVRYHYDKCDKNGYCHISVQEAQVSDGSADKWRGDGWGGQLFMHYKPDSGGTFTEVLATAVDDGWGFRPNFERTGYKDVWFDVCNHEDSTDLIAWSSCVRLHK
ncbi:hypothetical protein ABZ345_06760 [Lentzea sp. NPDC005914]|uniref:hypothetical protein n=1 Tax=Lentzea sp. NPDC005914 TaxID=3154572 RepID=UPI0033C4ED0E